MGYDKLKQKEYAAQHYQKNKAIYQERDRLRIERNRDWVREQKDKLCCIDCGEARPVCLDFHHIDDTTKLKSISEMVVSRYSIETIEAEVKKCIVVCANCHRVRHDGNIWTQDSNNGLKGNGES